LARANSSPSRRNVAFTARRFSVQTLQIVRMSSPARSACARVTALTALFRTGRLSSTSPAPQQGAAVISCNPMPRRSQTRRVATSSSRLLCLGTQPV
jgi:hypothetical protein